MAHSGRTLATVGDPVRAIAVMDEWANLLEPEPADQVRKIFCIVRCRTGGEKFFYFFFAANSLLRAGPAMYGPIPSNQFLKFFSSKIMSTCFGFSDPKFFPKVFYVNSNYYSRLLQQVRE